MKAEQRYPIIRKLFLSILLLFALTFGLTGRLPANARVEIVEKRTLNSKTYDNGNGSFTLEVHGGHVHYVDKTTGKLNQCDTALIDMGDKWVQTKASYHCDVPKYADGSFSFIDVFEEKNQTVIMRPLADHIQGEIDNSDGWVNKRILYRNAYGKGLHLRVTAGNVGLFKEIIIENKPIPLRDLSFDFEITPPSQEHVYVADAGLADTIRPVDLTNLTLTGNKQLLMGSSAMGENDFSRIRKIRIWDSGDNAINGRIQFYRKGSKLYFRKIVPKEFLSTATYPVYTDDVASYYSGAGDGWVKGKKANNDWDLVHNTGTGNQVDYTSAAENGGSILSGQTLGEFAVIHRVFFPIDATALPDDANITAASLFIWIYNTQSSDNDGYDYIAAVGETTQASPTSLGTADYDTCGAVDNPDVGSATYDISSIITGEYLEMVLNATGIGWIRKSGTGNDAYSRFGVREGHDIQDHPYAGGPGTWNFVKYPQSEYTGTTRDPYLSVTYNSAGVTISGTAYDGEGGSPLASKTIALRVDGGNADSVPTDGSGVYEFTNVVISPGSTITVWIDDDTTYKGTTVTIANGDITDLDIYGSAIIVRSESPTGITNDDLADYDGDNDPDIHFTCNSGTLTVNNDHELHIWTGDTFSPDGAVTTSSGGTSPGGDIHIDNNAAFTAGDAISCGGSWTADPGSAFAHNSNEVTLTATEAGKTITTNNQSFYTLTFDGIGGDWTFQDNVTVAGNFTITSGTVTGKSSGTITVGGNWSNSDTFTHNNSNVTLNATSTGKTVESGGSDFFDLTFNGSGGEWSFSDDATIANDLTISAGTVTSPSSGLIYVGNSWDVSGGTFTHNNSEVILNATDSANTVTSGSNGSFFNLTFNGSGGEWSFSDDATIANDLTIINGTVTGKSSGTITVGSNWSNSDTFTHNNSNVTFNATSTGKTIQSGGSDFFDLTFNGSGGAWTLQDNVTATNNFTISAGTVTAPSSSSVYVGNNWDVSGGTFAHNDSEVILNATDSGNTITSGSNGSFFNLTFDGAGGEWFFSDDATITNDLSITNGTVNAQGEFGSAGVVTYNSSGSDNDYGRGIAIDSAGNCYVVGYQPTNNNDIVVLKYDLSGNLDTTWGENDTGKIVYDPGGGQDSKGRAIAVDSSGCSYVLGDSDGAIIVVKYDSNGDRDTTWGDYDSGKVTYVSYSARDIAIDSSNNCYVVGDLDGEVMVLKYDPNGDLDTNWNDDGILTYGSRSSASGIAVDSSANVYVTGSVTVGEYEDEHLEIQTVKIDSSGAISWSRNYWWGAIGWENNIGRSIAVDSSGNSYVAGFRAYPDQGLAIKYDSNGNLDTTWSGDGRVVFDRDGYGVATHSGNCYVVGYQTGNGNDIVVLKYKSNGQLDTTWGDNDSGKVVYHSGGTQSDKGYGIAVDSSGGIYVVGDQQTNGYDIVVLRYNQFGDLSNNADLAVGRNWTNDDTFIHNECTVTFDGDGSTKAQQVKTGGSHWNAIEITNTFTAGVTFTDSFTCATFTDTTPGSELSFASGHTATITASGGLTLTGALGDLIELTRHEGSDPAHWNIDPQGGSWNVSCVYVEDSNNLHPTYINPPDSQDGGNNINWFTQGPGPLAYFVVDAPDSWDAGVAFSVTITAKDSEGITTTNVSGDTTLSVDAGVISPTFIEDAEFTDDGIWTGYVTLSQAGSRTITATNNGNTGQDTIIIIAGTNALDGFTVDAPTYGCAGVPFSVTIVAEDSEGITTTNVSGDTTLSVDAGTISPTSIAASEFTDDGIWTGDVTLSQEGSRTITATNNGNTGQDTVIINDVCSFTVDAPGSEDAGVAFSVTITAEDSEGITTTNVSGDTTLSVDAGIISPTSIPASEFTDDGIWTGDVTLSQEGLRTITATNDPATGQDTITINPGEFASFTVDAPDSECGNDPFSVTITAKDSGGNTTTNISGETTLSVDAGTISPTSIAEEEFTDDGVWTGDVTLSLPGSRTVVAENDLMIGGDTITINACGGALDRFIVDGPASGYAGEAFSVMIIAEDSEGNATANVSGNTTLSVDAGTISPTSIPASEFTDDGVWIGDITLSLPGLRTITATNNAKTGQHTMTIDPGPLDHFIVDAPDSAYVTLPFSVTITAKDSEGNTTTWGYSVDYFGWTQLQSDLGGISPTLIAEEHFIDDGVWTGDVTLSQVGLTTITASVWSISGPPKTGQDTITVLEIPEYTLTMAVAGSGSTTPAVGDHVYLMDTVVDISALPGLGWEFDDWTGDVADAESVSTTVTMDEAHGSKTVTANFSWVESSQFHHAENCAVCHDTYSQSDNLAAIPEEIDLTRLVVPKAGTRSVTYPTGVAGGHVRGADPWDGICEVCHTQTHYYTQDGECPPGSGTACDPHHPDEDCSTCHAHCDEFWHGAGGCKPCHGHDAGWIWDPEKDPSEGKGSVQSHATHTEDSADDHDIKGPFRDCDRCHNIDNFWSFNSGADQNTDGRIDLSETDVCNDCHSPYGAFDGVAMAKANWKVGMNPDKWDSNIYKDDRITLRSGKEHWCATCHDDAPDTATNESAVVEGVYAPGMAGVYVSNDTWDPPVDCRSGTVSGPVIAEMIDGDTGTANRRPWRQALFDLGDNYLITDIQMYVKDATPDGISWQVFAGDGSNWTRVLGAQNPLFGWKTGHSGAGWYQAKMDVFVTAQYLKIAQSVGPCPPGTIFEVQFKRDDLSYGYFDTGHRIKCHYCHDFGTAHVDGVLRTYEASTGNYQEGYRLGELANVVPRETPVDSTEVDPADFPLCFDCHDNQAAFLDGTNMTDTNFRDDSHAVNDHFRHLKPYGNDFVFDSDFDGTADSDMTCTACHNVHGSPTPGMVRHGELIRRDGLINKIPGLNLRYIDSNGDPDGYISLAYPNSFGAQTYFWGPGPGTISKNGICNMCHNEYVRYMRSAVVIDPPSGFQVIVLCPVDLRVIDPDGLIVDKVLNEIEGASYFEGDINGDDRDDDRIIIPYRKIGDYTILVLPESDPDPGDKDVYTLNATVGDQSVVLAEDVPIGTPGSEDLYTVTSTESGMATQYIDLVSPENGALLPKKGFPTFSWDSEGYQEFKVEFSKEPDFLTTDTLALPSEGWLSGSPFTPTKREWKSVGKIAGNKGRVYWRVIGKDTEGTLAFSDTRDFIVADNDERQGVDTNVGIIKGDQGDADTSLTSADQGAPGVTSNGGGGSCFIDAAGGSGRQPRFRIFAQ